MTQITSKLTLSPEIDYEFAPFRFEQGQEAAAMFAGRPFHLQKGHQYFGIACTYAHPHKIVVFHPQNIELDPVAVVKVTIIERQYTFDIKKNSEGNSFVECVPNWPIHGSGGCPPGLIPKHVTRLMHDGLWIPDNAESLSYPMYIKMIEPALERVKQALVVRR